MPEKHLGKVGLREPHATAKTKSKSTFPGDVGRAIGPVALYRSNTDNHTALAHDGEGFGVLQLLQTDPLPDNFDARGGFCVRKIAGRAGAWAILLRLFPWGPMRLLGAHSCRASSVVRRFAATNRFIFSYSPVERGTTVEQLRVDRSRHIFRTRTYWKHNGNRSAGTLFDFWNVSRTAGPLSSFFNGSCLRLRDS
jgi:hypothetical protein